jgi:HEAT repeat protein
VRESAARALGGLGDTYAIEPLAAALADGSAGVRAAAAEALGKLGDARVFAPLVEALADHRYDVCRMAARSLARLGWRPSYDESGARYYLALHLIDQAVEIGPCVVKPLITVLIEDDSRSMRAAAARALGEIGDRRAVGPLIACLNNRHTSEMVRSAVAEALGKTGDASAVRPLRTTLLDSDAEVRETARAALEQIDTRLGRTGVGV